MLYSYILIGFSTGILWFFILYVYVRLFSTSTFFYILLLSLFLRSCWSAGSPGLSLFFLLLLFFIDLIFRVQSIFSKCFIIFFSRRYSSISTFFFPWRPKNRRKPKVRVEWNKKRKKIDEHKPDPIQGVMQIIKNTGILSIDWDSSRHFLWIRLMMDKVSF